MTSRHRIGLVGCGRLAEARLPPCPRARRTVRSSSRSPTPTRSPRRASRASPAATGTTVAMCTDATDAARRGRTRRAWCWPRRSADAPRRRAHRVDGRGRRCSSRSRPRSTPPAPAALAALTPPPWVGFNRRFDPGAAARPRRASRPRATSTFASRSTTDGAAGAPAPVHDDALLDLGPHLVDWARWLTGSEVVDGDRRASSARAAPSSPCASTAAGPRIVAATDRLHHERDRGARPAGRTARPPLASGGLVAAVRGALRARRRHPLVTSLVAQLDEFVRAGARRAAERARYRGRRSRGDVGHRRAHAPASPAAAAPFRVPRSRRRRSRARHPAVRRRQRRRCSTGCSPRGACRPSPAYAQRGSWHDLDAPATRSRPARSTRSTAVSSSATTGSSTRSSGRRPTSGCATWTTSTPRRRSGSASAAHGDPHPRRRPLREPTSGRAASGRAGVRMAAARPRRAAAVVVAATDAPAARAPLRRARARRRGVRTTQRRRDARAAAPPARRPGPGRRRRRRCYLGEQPFDLAWLTFCAAHVAGHQFWDLSQLDARRPRRRHGRGARQHPRRRLRRHRRSRSDASSARCPTGTDVMVVSPSAWT